MIYAVIFNRFSTKNTPSRAACLALLILSAFPGAAAHAAELSWTGNSSSTWADGSNWSGGAAPANSTTTDTALFNQASYTNQPNYGTTSIRGFTVGEFSEALTINGTELTIGSGGVTINAGADNGVILNGSIRLDGNQTWTKFWDSRSVNINANITNNSSTVPVQLTIDASAPTALNGTDQPNIDVIFSGVISDNGNAATSVKKTGLAGVGFHGNQSTFSGDLTIQEGSVALRYDQGNTSLKFSGASGLRLQGGSIFSTGTARTQSGAVAVERVNGTHVEAGFNRLMFHDGQGSDLNLGHLSRNRGVLVFTDNSLAANFLTSTSNTNGILGAWAIIGDRFNVSDWAMNSTNGANGAITAYTGYVDIGAQGSVIQSDSSANFRILANGSGGNILLGNDNTIINTLMQSNNATAATIAVQPEQSLRSSGIMVASGGANLTIGTVPGSGTLTTKDAGGELFLYNFSQNATFLVNSVIADNQSPSHLTKSGLGRVILSAENTYTGVTSVNYGTLQFAKINSLYNGNQSFWNADKITVSPGHDYWSPTATQHSTLAFNIGGLGEFGNTEIDILLSGLASSNSVTSGMRKGSSIGFDTTNASGGNFTLSQNIGDTTGEYGGSRGLTKLGSGTLTLTGNNTYSYTTLVESGTLATNGNERISDLSAISVAVGGTFMLGGNETVGSIYGGGNFSLGNFSLTVGVDNVQQYNPWTRFGSASGVISGTGSLIKVGDAMLTLSGNNTFTGGLTINSGMVDIRSAQSGGAGTIVLGDTAGSNNATILLGLGVSLNGSITNNITVRAGSTGTLSIVSQSASGSNEFSGAMALHNNLFVSNAYATPLLFSGSITQDASARTITKGNGSGAVNISGATTLGAGGLTLASRGGVFTLSGGITGTGNLTINNNSSQANGITISTASANNTGTITNAGSGTGSVLISSVIGTNVTGVVQNSANSTLTLSGNNTFTSGLTINSGTVSGTASGAFGAGAITLGDTAGSNNATLTTSFDGTYTNNITVRSGSSGTLSITGATNNTTLSGAVALNNNLTVDHATSSRNLTLSGAITQDASARTITKGNGSGAVNISGATTLRAGGLTLASRGGGVFTLSGGLAGTGDLTINNNSSTANAITISTASANNTGTITNSGSGTGSALISGGVGSNVTGITQNSTTSNLTVSGALAVNSNGTTLTAQNGNMTISGGIGGTGNLTINNNSSTANAITISTASANNTGTITNSGSGTGGVLISSIIGTNVARVVQDSATSTLTLSGANTFTGGLAINSGTVTGTVAGAMGTASNTITFGGAGAGVLNLQAAATTYTALLNVASANGTVSINPASAGAGVTHTVGATTLGGGNQLTVQAGSLATSGTAQLTTGAVTLTGNATLNAVNTANASTILRLGALNDGGTARTITLVGNGTVLLGNAAANLAVGTQFLVNSGTLNATIAGALANSTTANATTVTVNTGGELRGSIANAFKSSGAGTPNQAINLSGGTVRLANSAATDFGGNLNYTSGNVVLDRTSSGTAVTHTMGSLRIGSATLAPTIANFTTTPTLAFGGTSITGNAVLDASQVLFTLGTLSAATNTSLTTLGANTVNASAITLGGDFALSANGTGIFTASGGITGSGNLTINNNGTTANAITISTASANNTGTITNSGSGTGGVLISGGVGSNVTGITQNSATSDLTISTAALTVNSNGTTLTAQNGNMTISSGISGSGNLTINGNGSAASTIQFSINSINHNGAIINSGSGAGEVSISSIIGTNVTEIVQNSATSTLVLSGQNTYTGATTINAGTLQIGNGSTSGSITSNITNNAALVFKSSNNSTYSGIISGTGMLEKLGNGTLTLTGNNSATGNITITAGTLQLGNGGTTGSVAGAITNNGTLAINRSDDLTFANTMSGTGSVVKLGNNTLTYNSTATPNGGTFVNAGTLVVSGTTSAVTINANGTLAGNGTVGNVVINSGGTIAPGNSPGTLTTGNMTWNGGGIYNWQLGNATGTAGTDWDLISSSGSLTINATTGSKFVINASNDSVSGFDPQATSYKWQMANFSGSITGFSTDKFAINTTGFDGTTGIGAFSVSANSTALSLNYRTLFVWDAGNGTWSTDTNWLDNALPVNGAPIEFAGLGGNSTNNNYLTSISGLTFTANAGEAYTLAGGNLSIGAGGIVNNSSYAQTLGLNIALGANQTFAANTANLNISGNISGGYSLTKEGSETLTLSGHAAHTGGTTLNTGTLVIGNVAAAGTGTISQTDGTSLLKIDTTGTIANNMSVYNVLASQSATLSGAITVNNASWDIETGDTLTISGAVSGNGGVTKNGAGTLILSGSNSYASATTVNAGTLTANNANALGSNTTVQVNGGSLLVTADDAINGKNITLNSTAIGSAAAASLAFSGTYNGTAGSLTLNADSIIDLGTGSVALHFSNMAMGIYNLAIYNWTGTTLWGGGDRDNTDQFYVDRTVSDNELNRISFYSGISSSSFVGTGFQLSGSFNQQIIPVPEPETWATGILLLVSSGIWLWRKRTQTA